MVYVLNQEGKPLMPTNRQTKLPTRLRVFVSLTKYYFKEKNALSLVEEQVAILIYVSWMVQ